MISKKIFLINAFRLSKKLSRTSSEKVFGGAAWVFALGEDSFALLLTSELDALCDENVNRTLLRLWRAEPFQVLGLCPTKTKRTLLAGVLLFWRCRPDLNRRITVLQTGALPLGYCTKLLVTPTL